MDLLSIIIIIIILFLLLLLLLILLIIKIIIHNIPNHDYNASTTDNFCSDNYISMIKCTLLEKVLDAETE